MKYEGRANAVVIVEWILFLIVVVIVGMVGAVRFQEFAEQFESSNDEIRNGAVISVVLVSVVILIQFLFNFLLTRGVKKGHSTALKVWYILSIIGTVFLVLDFIIAVIAVLTLVSSGVVVPLFLVILIRGGYLWYRIWSINVIMEFTKGLTSSSGTGGGIVYSTTHTPNYPITEKV